MTSARVVLWGREIGAVALSEGERAARFQYHSDFVGSGIEPAPLTMPLRSRPYSFPALAESAFHGLPGLLADSLPDRYGNALIDAWLAGQGRPPGSFDAVERLCYTGARGMGALEFRPALGVGAGSSSPLQVSALVELASSVLQRRSGLSARLAVAPGDALESILQVGTSAGGARAKAVIAWNAATGEVRSGQVDAPPGFEHWLLKFDGVAGNGDKELEDPRGYGAIELAYARMAGAAGVTMAPCRLLEEKGRRHFMTRRFDRPQGRKLHMQSLAALLHLDFNLAGAWSYEQALQAMSRLRLARAQRLQLLRRMVFNVVARNQDDHVKNIAFLMDRRGRWRLAPAFDVTWSYNPAGAWTSQHQMSIHGKRDRFDRADIEAVGALVPLKRGEGARILGEVTAAVRGWPEHARGLRIPAATIDRIGRSHRLELAG